jgi:hypothetical protein
MKRFFHEIFSNSQQSEPIYSHRVYPNEIRNITNSQSRIYVEKVKGHANAGPQTNIAGQ